MGVISAIGMFTVSIILIVLGIIQIGIGSAGFALSKNRLFFILIGTGALFFFPMTCTVGKVASSNKEKARQRLEEMGPLFLAIDEKEPDEVEKLFSQGKKGNSPVGPEEINKVREIKIKSRYVSHTPLSFSCYKRTDTITEYLLKQGADPNIADLDVNGFAVDKTPLLYALSRKNFPLTKILLDYGADPNLGTFEEDPLSLAVEKGEISLIKLLIDHGAKESIALDENGFAKEKTPLMKAIEENNYELAGILLDNGSDINLGTKDQTPFSLALINGDLEKVKFLVDRGALPKAQLAILTLAFSNPDVELLQYVYQSGLDKEVNPKAGHLPFNVSMKHKDALDFSLTLISLGADIFAADPSGDTALHTAAREGNLEMVDYLLKRGFDINVKNLTGETPFFLAATTPYSGFDDEEKKQVIALLIEKGADISLTDIRGDTYIEHNDHFFGEDDSERRKLKEIEDFISGLSGE